MTTLLCTTDSKIYFIVRSGNGIFYLMVKQPIDQNDQIFLLVLDLIYIKSLLMHQK